jgi:hypothetical protein
MDDKEMVAWLAGILEGEGSFCWRGRKTAYGIPYIRVGMADKDIVERISDIIGGNVHPEKPRKLHYKIQYRLSISGKPAIIIMKLILPHMGERRSKKIRELIQKWEVRPGYRKGSESHFSKLTPEQVKEIRKRYADGNETWRSLANEFGVTKRSIGNIVSNKAWKWLK